jgi:glycosyltransferase involved in cell wall biosynthesis
MHVLYIVTRGDAIGGASMHVLQLARSVAQSGHQVTLLFGGVEGKIVGMCKEAGLETMVLPQLLRSLHPWHDLMVLFQLRALIKKINPDIVHLHSAKAALLGRIASYLCAIPAVVTIHGWPFVHPQSKVSKTLYFILERSMVALTAKFITVSQVDYDIARQRLAVQMQQLELIHNGIEYDQSFATGKSDTINQQCSIICVARFETQKDHRTLLLALQQIKSLPWSLKLVGSGPLLEETKKLAGQLSVSEKVEFLGERSDVASLLEQADLFVLLSHWESLPISIIEAMRAGLPVIASKVGGVAELVDDGISGKLVTAGDISEAAAALRSLITDPALRHSMSNASTAKFLQNFTAELMLQKTLNCYQQLAKVKQ